MKHLTLLIGIFLCGLSGCNKSSAPAAAPTGAAPSNNDAVHQKLQQYAGGSATDCGRLDVHAAEAQTKAASDCALQASQGKRAFYVAYDMPGMAVGVAGNSDGKLFTVQSQDGTVNGEDCPSQLRVASSGRITCFAPGDMGSMSAGHVGGAVPPGMANPHGGTASPHGTAKPPSN